VAGALAATLALAGCGPASLKQHYYGSPDPPPALVFWQTRPLPETGTPVALRNAQLASAMAQVDAGYSVFRLQYFANRTTFDTVGDIVGLGLNAAGTAFGGAALKSALAATAGSVLGLRAIVDQDVFAQSSRVAIVMTMDADRASVRDRILQGMTQPIERYPLEVGMADVQRYYDAGSVVNAIIAVTTQASIRAKGATTP